MPPQSAPPQATGTGMGTIEQKGNVPSFSPGSHAAGETLAKFRKLLEPHVQGFNYFVDKGVKQAFKHSVRYGVTVRTRDDTDPAPCVEFWFENPTILKPSTTQMNSSVPLLPKHARELGVSYTGEMRGDFCWRVISPDGSSSETQRLSRRLGEMPIMLGSSRCHTHKKSPNQLVAMGEESNEFGGCFIVSGIERCVRLLQVPRRNHMLAIKRPTYKSRGASYSPYGVAIRSSRWTDDCSSISNTLHYLTSGGATLRFSVRKQEFLVPVVVILRALTNTTDAAIYSKIVAGDESNTFVTDRVTLLLHDAKQFNLYTSEECLAYIGARFRNIASRLEHNHDVEVGQFIIDEFIMVHLRTNEAKSDALILMLRKLYCFVQGSCGADNADSMQNLEVLLPGHLICAFVKEKVEETLQGIRIGIMKDIRTDINKVLADHASPKFWARAVDRYGGGAAGSIGKKVSHFLSTGNIISTTGLDLMQVSGYTIVAERLNFLRYISHYRSIHRGQFFTTMKTTTVRKLLPDSWGFLCPVHTPDGGPCGLLNHLAVKCEAQSHPLPEKEVAKLPALLVELGVTPLSIDTPPYNHLTVCIDGEVIGSTSVIEGKKIAYQLRSMKVTNDVPNSLEVAYFPPMDGGAGPFPGLYLFTGLARAIRPVQHIESGKVEFIGPMEQPFLDIACLPTDVRDETTHQELDPTNMLSLIASMTPFSDYNQSPRNMYQCQMGKQTMGTPSHALPHRTDNKLYRLQNPQSPIVQTARHAEFSMDDYPNGCNAVVAVLSYTGFDMEDAMILNKSSYERGFGHASVYKTKIVDLKEEGERGGGESRLRFTNRKKSKGPGEEDEIIDDSLGEDGLPQVGAWVNEGDALYAYVDDLTGKEKIGKHKEMEKACVQNVRLLGSETTYSKGGRAQTKGLERLSVTLRIPRNPVIGDKFSSRHGQKGVMSILWPSVDMPFSESGISPDVIINPHAFPSRMTIGMLIESMAGKAGAMHGTFQDATPFQFHESGDKLAVDHFGEQLQAAGYSYYGSEALYSGVSGECMHADLYMGVVFYQRLRHMVSDKYQVRATGQVNQLTRQPIKGRKKGGGIRLGEMERDALLSHGAAFLLHDRLMMCSDAHTAHCCARCGGIISARTERSAVLSAGGAEADVETVWVCQSAKCRGQPEQIEPVSLPYVFSYLQHELSGMGIKLSCELK